MNCSSSDDSHRSFTKEIASLNPATGTRARIGPNISSLMSMSSGVTSLTTVGAIYLREALLCPPKTMAPFVFWSNVFKRLKCDTLTMREKESDSSEPFG